MSRFDDTPIKKSLSLEILVVMFLAVVLLIATGCKVSATPTTTFRSPRKAVFLYIPLTKANAEDLAAIDLDYRFSYKEYIPFRLRSGVGRFSECVIDN